MLEGRTGARRRRGGAVGLSLLVHAGLLLVLGWTAPRMGVEPAPAPPDFIIVLAPASRARPPQAEDSHAQTAAPFSLAPHLERTPSPSAVEAQAAARPAAASPAAAATAAAGGPTAASAGAESGDVRGFLRATVGCGHRDAVGLTSAERERCDELAGAQGRAAPSIDTIPAEKRAYYDAVAKAYAELHYPTPVGRQPGLGTGAAGAFADPPSAMPGRMPAVGCRILFGKPRGWKPPPGGVPHALNLGPCFAAPPKGPLDPEVDLPDPTDIHVK